MAASSQFIAAHRTQIWPKRHLFFPGMALFAVGLVLLAFIPQYFGHQRMSFPVAWAIRMHAAIMNAWIAMFFVQAYLGATGRTTQHRKIGKFGIALGWLALFSMISVQYRSLLLNPLPEEMQTYDWLLPFSLCLFDVFSFSLLGLPLPCET